MPLLQLLKNTTTYEEIPLNLNGRYRVRIIGFDISDANPALPLFSYINSNVLGVADKCVGTTSRFSDTQSCVYRIIERTN